MKVTAVTCVKNEGPFLLEWIAFHRLIGVTDFLIYSNDCDDGTDKLLDALAETGLITHLPNPARGRNYQMQALKNARRHPSVLGADWVWVADVDEFLNIRVGNKTISALVEACGYPQAISVSFQYFANSGIDAFVDQPVISQFLQTHNPDIWCAERAIEVKTLVRADFPLQYLGAHRPFFKRSLPKQHYPAWTDGSGRPVPNRFRTAAHERRIRRFPARGARQFASLNHYALRSLDSYLVKIDRGDVNRPDRSFDVGYWRERNDPAWKETSILSHLPALEEALAQLMTQEQIAACHFACVAAHLAKRDRLLMNPSYRAIRHELRAAPSISQDEEALLRQIGFWPMTQGIAAE